jgi:hypothetical protein
MVFGVWSVTKIISNDFFLILWLFILLFLGFIVELVLMNQYIPLLSF